MPEIRTFDAITWINTHLNSAVQLDFEQLKPILCFSLLWNMFESKACKKWADKKTIRGNVNSADELGLLQTDRYREFIEFFKTRYVVNGSVDSALRALVFRDNDAESKDIVRRFLLGEYIDANNTVYSLLLIAYRIRNNLFHGNKDVELLPNQTELFTAINALLSTYLEDIANMPPPGRQPRTGHQRGAA